MLTTLTKFVNLLAVGRAASTVIPHLGGAILLASKKKKGAHCPIAVGKVLCCLFSKCLTALVLLSPISLLAPLQLGMGVRGGCEEIVHATSQLMPSLPDEQCWTLPVNFTNMFNNISREAMFVEFHHRLLGLSVWMESCYCGQPLFLLGKDCICSCCGVYQGDPLGPLGLFLHVTLHPIVERNNAQVPTFALNA